MMEYHECAYSFEHIDSREFRNRYERHNIVVCRLNLKEMNFNRMRMNMRDFYHRFHRNVFEMDRVEHNSPNELFLKMKQIK